MTHSLPRPLQNESNIPKGGYVAFDAMSLRQIIINRLNEQGVYTDQNYIGSNLAAIIDIVSYAFHTLIYYLNTTATESMFTEAQLYENINRIVKLIDYSPIGAQTSTLAFSCSASELINKGYYTIPRYSYLLIDSIPFSVNEDLVFAKTQNGVIEDLRELSQQKLLYQGIYNEYPVYTATGETNEVLILDTPTQTVDHFNIDVYVKPVITNTWRQYTKSPNLFLEDGDAEKYEIRLNSNNRYEIKFGNNINGRQLQTGDQVAIYYLVSNKKDGEVGAGVLNSNTSLLVYSTPQYNQILENVNTNNNRYLPQSQAASLLFNNESASTVFVEKETANEIRKNAPAVYKSQYRLVTTADYEALLKTNFSYLFADIKAINNHEYVSSYLKYFYNLGLTNPTNTNRALLNQIQYADSCNFNNVYLIAVPKTATSRGLDYMLPAQKELIKSVVEPTKMTTAETCFVDPVYKAVTFGIGDANIIEDVFADLVVTKKSNSRRDAQSLIFNIARVFENYFSKERVRLGQVFDVRLLTQMILDVPDIESIATVNRLSPTINNQGLSFYMWNPVYVEFDNIITQNNINMQSFEYIYFDDIANITDRIKIIESGSSLSLLEY